MVPGDLAKNNDKNLKNSDLRVNVLYLYWGYECKEI